MMIRLDDVRIGNWISLRLAGSLIAAHRILDKDEFKVYIAGGTEYVLLQIVNVGDMKSNRE